jgi:hypothetical protein
MAKNSSRNTSNKKLVNRNIVQQVGIKYNVCNRVAPKMYNIKFVQAVMSAMRLLRSCVTEWIVCLVKVVRLY